MTRYAVVENETKKVVNCVIWEGAEWLPPKNHLVIRSDQANIGDTFYPETNTFLKENP